MTAITVTRVSQIVLLLDKLDKEICSGNLSESNFADELAMFENRRSSEEHKGFAAKLTHAGRDDEIESAEEKLELFDMLLLKFRHFPSAQRIFAYFLWRIRDVFDVHIKPNISNLSRQEVESIIEQKIIEPTIADMGDGFAHFTLYHAHIRGMIYWLADRCFVRWH